LIGTRRACGTSRLLRSMNGAVNFRSSAAVTLQRRCLDTDVSRELTNRTRLHGISKMRRTLAMMNTYSSGDVILGIKSSVHLSKLPIAPVDRAACAKYDSSAVFM
jgi:hypothetical protein